MLAQGEVVAISAWVDAARPIWERVVRMALVESNPVLLARAALAHAHRPELMGAPPAKAVLECLRAARERPSGDVSLEARVASRLGAELVAAGTEHVAEGEALVREGETRARALGDPFTLARVLFDVNAARLPALDPRGWLARRRGRLAQGAGTEPFPPVLCVRAPAARRADRSEQVLELPPVHRRARHRLRPPVTRLIKPRSRRWMGASPMRARPRRRGGEYRLATASA
jgi:hypothetical protein